jgi:hypothetical protein
MQEVLTFFKLYGHRSSSRFYYCSLGTDFWPPTAVDL